MIISLDFANYVSRGIGLNILLWEMINFPAKKLLNLDCYWKYLNFLYNNSFFP